MDLYKQKNISNYAFRELAFDHEITETKIMTDDKSIDEVVEEIAEKSGLTLLPNKRGRGPSC